MLSLKQVSNIFTVIAMLALTPVAVAQQGTQAGTCLTCRTSDGLLDDVLGAANSLTDTVQWMSKEFQQLVDFETFPEEELHVAATAWYVDDQDAKSLTQVKTIGLKMQEPKVVVAKNDKVKITIRTAADPEHEGQEKLLLYCLRQEIKGGELSLSIEDLRDGCEELSKFFCGKKTEDGVYSQKGSCVRSIEIAVPKGKVVKGLHQR